jgi:hypothetical protein
VQEVEGVVGRALGRRIVGDDAAQRVRREDFGGGEVAPREGRLATGRDADQQDQRIGGEREDRRNGPAAEVVGGRRRSHRDGCQPWASQSGHISESGIGAFG